jgi:predicted transposase/invertase (TIGR01784 family)
MMTKYLDPIQDVAFWLIFNRHKHLCKSLLNSMLPLEAGQQIVELEYLQPEMAPKILALKDSIFDVRCTDNREQQFIVEIKIYWIPIFKVNVSFSASKAYITQLNKNQEYHLQQPVYALNFVNEVFDNDPSTYYHHYRIVNVANTEKQIDGLEFVFIELPKFTPVHRAEKKLYELWLTFLTQADEEGGVPPALLEEEVTREALHYLEISSYTRGELEAYDRYWDAIRTERTYYLDAMTEGLAKGKAEGLAKGKAEGLAEGKAEGLAEGKAEGLTEGLAKGKAEGKAEALREIVVGAMHSGATIAQIQAITGLSEEKIDEMLH